MAVAQAAGVLTVFAAAPFVIGRLGEEGYGAWELLLVFQSVALIFHNIVRGTLIWRLSLCCGKSDHDEARRLIRVTCALVLATVTLVAPLAIVLSPSIVSILGLQEPWETEIRILIPAVLSLVLLSGVTQSLLALITAYQQAGRSAAIHALNGIVSSAIAIGLLLSGAGMVALPLGMLGGSIIALIVARRVARLLLGEISILPTLPTRHDIGLLGPFAGMLLISNLTVLARDHTDKFLAVGLGGLHTVANLSLASRLASLSLQLSAVLLTPFTAAVGVLYSRDDWAGCMRLYEKIGLLVALAAGVISFLTHALRVPLFTLWVGEARNDASPYLTLLLVAGFLAIAYSGVGVSLAKAIGRPGIETEYTLVTLAIVLATKPLLVGIAGPIGAVASSTIGWGIGSAYLAYISLTRLRLPSRLIYNVNRVAIVTLGLQWIASPRICDALPNITTRAQAAGLLVVAIPLLGSVYFLVFLATRYALNLITPDPRSVLGGADESQFFNEGDQHVLAA